MASTSVNVGAQLVPWIVMTEGGESAAGARLVAPTVLVRAINTSALKTAIDHPSADSRSEREFPHFGTTHSRRSQPRLPPKRHGRGRLEGANPHAASRTSCESRVSPCYQSGYPRLSGTALPSLEGGQAGSEIPLPGRPDFLQALPSREGSVSLTGERRGPSSYSGATHISAASIAFNPLCGAAVDPILCFDLGIEAFDDNFLAMLERGADETGRLVLRRNCDLENYRASFGHLSIPIKPAREGAGGSGITLDPPTPRLNLAPVGYGRQNLRKASRFDSLPVQCGSSRNGGGNRGRKCLAFRVSYLGSVNPSRLGTGMRRCGHARPKAWESHDLGLQVPHRVDNKYRHAVLGGTLGLGLVNCCEKLCGR